MDLTENIAGRLFIDSILKAAYRSWPLWSITFSSTTLFSGGYVAEDYFDDAYDRYEQSHRPWHAPPKVKCNQCGALCVWRDEPGRGWKLYELGELHVCPNRRPAKPEGLDG